MARYRIYQNNNRMSKAYGKYYLKPVVEGEISTDELAEIVQNNASVKNSDVVAVLKEMKEVIQNYIGLGYKIRLDGIGTLQVRLHSDGALTAAECTPSTCIKSVGVLYRPEMKLNGKVYTKPLLNKLRWKELADYTSPKVTPDDGDGQNP